MEDVLLRRLFAVICRNICAIDIIPSGFLIPMEDEVDSFGELGIIPLIDAACIYPEVPKTISRSFVRAELDLLPPNLYF